uniref:Derlin n=1 Tax=Prorocentrum minimum TaxID=39449 RepID=W8PD38_PROMN|nr:Der1 [Prorocentrum minimum]|mmetsp:Transcript_121419/g.329773  ORF Transcript_121419/g.329773 Transcript_121419/m.329773 type:complete len:216 (+) Transcript_121419:87-734(+)
MNLNVVLGQQLPPVTLSLGVASVTLMCLCSLEVITPLDLYLNWNLVLYEMQLWRLVTCFLFFGDFGLAFFWNIHVLMHYCCSLEDATFHGKTADFLWMLICGAALMLCLTYMFGSEKNLFYSGTLIDIMAYIWSRRNPSAQLLLFFFPIKALYLPWVLACFALLMGSSIKDETMGIFVGHVYFFFEDVYPVLPTSKGFRLFRTPKLLKVLCRQRD